MDKKRLAEILESHGIINVTYKDNPVWLESIGTDKDEVIQVKDLKTDRLIQVDIKDLKE
ncbi:H-type small acid-soluble spore protein [Clostridium estertheticum]|uniref:H-type small acid-soluble spore protein n=1 Tax=Clostridium estertheticum TaxID=238834 RepID=UPI0013E8F713|nr:H-type small acid-soluble spore protein [Clostridium estertheticum]MBZ9686963.1 H-type small acid-soluble spore protein [Clostridium estertheticum]